MAKKRTIIDKLTEMQNKRSLAEEKQYDEYASFEDKLQAKIEAEYWDYKIKKYINNN